MERYVKVPVEFRHIPTRKCGNEILPACVDASMGGVLSDMGLRYRGTGSTEDEAFADLLTKLGYEEAK